ncbi:hypothetical protein WR25_15094 [Diploscapter pachys]|uniref:Uncharacterized protein n=1 Tax=Diploscapter pachys TaxID=2018661 RepID=A0A2A2KFQ1_9BILA|nr:hypothetical protein WR25_15094 [Diploscapter pachys]
MITSCPQTSPLLIPMANWSEDVLISQSRFSNSKDLADSVFVAISVERAEQERAAKKMRAGLIWHDIVRDERNELVFHFQLPDITNMESKDTMAIRVSIGDFGKIEGPQESKWERHGIITKLPDLTDDNYCILLNGTSQDLTPKWKSNEITFQVLYNPVPFERECAALKKFVEVTNFNETIRQAILGAEVSLDDLKINDEVPEYDIQGLPPFNSFQQAAIKMAINNRVAIIEGPGGTGKTDVLAAIAFHLSKNLKEDEILFVCSPSNAAADECALRIMKTGLNPVRVVAESRQMLESRVPDILLHRLIRDILPTEFKKLDNIKKKRKLNNGEQQRFKELKTQAELEIIRQRRIVCCTTSSSAMEILREFKPVAIIVDEAGQGSISNVLVPVMTGANQLILVGDTAQLPPLVTSPKALSAGLGVSLMERLGEFGLPKEMLRVQHRMVPSLSAFPNEQFYGGLLLDGENTEKLVSYSSKWKWIDVSNPKAFLSSFYEETKVGRSIGNDGQAKEAIVLANKLIISGIDPSDIAILSFYDGQRRIISRLIRDPIYSTRDKKLREIEVSTVDSFQGRENKYIIVCTVRCNERNKLGFISDRRRINLALTRPQAGLFILGNYELLSVDKTWNALLNCYVNEGVLMEGDLDSMKSIKPKLRTPLSSLPPDDENVDEDQEECTNNFALWFTIYYRSRHPFQCKACNTPASSYAQAIEHLRSHGHRTKAAKVISETK